MIVSYNTIELLRECLQAVHQHSKNIATQVIVVDNASSDNSPEMVMQEFPQVTLLKMTDNLGFGVANNIGVEAANSPYVMLLNSDAILLGDVGKSLVNYLATHADVSCVAPRVVLPNGAPQPKVYGQLPSAWRIWMQSLGINQVFPKQNLFSGIDGLLESAKSLQVGWLSGVCMVMRRQDYLNVGGFDQRFFMYCEDVDLCVKLNRSIGRVVLVGEPDVLHYGGASSKTVSAKQRNAVWQQRHLLMIVRERCGNLSWASSMIAIMFGLCVRLIAGVVLIPLRGIRFNDPLNMAWARLVDLVRFNAANTSKSL